MNRFIGRVLALMGLGTSAVPAFRPATQKPNEPAPGAKLFKRDWFSREKPGGCPKMYGARLARTISNCTGKPMIVLLVLCLSLSSFAQVLPSAPIPQGSDPDKTGWVLTGTFTSAFVGATTRPWVGLASGVAVSLISIPVDRDHSKENAALSIGGAVVGYVAIKTLAHDWKRRKQ
jgi:hypothetical protein